MTTVSTFEGFLDELQRLKETKENPDEWYFVAGKETGEYSVHTAEAPEDVQDAEPPEGFEDANENVDGFYQIGTMGWSAQAFAEDVDFVREVGISNSFDKIDRRVNGLLLVHESQLSEEAVEVAEDKDAEEVPADD